MEYNKFKKKAIEHLAKYASARPNELRIGGSWQDKGSYDHILDLTSYSSKDEAILMNVLKDERKKFEDHLQNYVNIHEYAYHLNSSQIMCFNYFLHFLTWESGAFRPMSELFRNVFNKINPCVTYNSDSRCEFEKIRNYDHTNFDFYALCGNSEFFFEIKYTEEGFNAYTGEKTSPEVQFNNVFKPLIKNSAVKDNAFLENGSFDEDSFVKYYQLFRNAISVDNNNKYSIFLVPKENQSCIDEFNLFKNRYIKEQYNNNVRLMLWDDSKLEIAQKYPEFYKKYFDIDWN